ncbi:nicotinamide phosphoribosyl transferase [Escherichia phage vB_EcoM_ESCO56]|nr:nicotinamide phosphoribosyl transferase [Escherichia phage vB_EcoM_ESCO56]
MWDGDKLKAVDGYGFQSFADVLDHPACALRLVFSDSKQFGYTTLGDIRNNIDKQL